MKVQRIGILLLVLGFIGVSIVFATLVRYEQRKRTRARVNKGGYLVTLIALHSIRDFAGNKRSSFLKTLHESIASEGLAYCIIHDHTGDPFVILDPYKLVSRTPEDVRMRSIYTMGLTHQTFETIGSGDTIYEFSKSVFENGERTGTVRLGLRPVPISLFSMERVGLLATIAFFIFAMVPFLFYGIRLALQPLKKVSSKMEIMTGGAADVEEDKDKGSAVDDLIVSLDQSLGLLTEKYRQLKNVNTELQAERGVIAYKKKQIVQILDAMHYGVIITDTQENVTHLNAYMLNLLNKELCEVIERPLGEVLENDAILALVAQQEGVSPTKAQRHIETTFPEHASGETFEVILSHLTDGDGSVISKVISVTNMTTQTSVERTKHEFVAHVAHELRAPLTTIRSYNEMLMDGEIDDLETQKEFFNTINEETDRLARLIENLLNMSKIEMGSLTLERKLIKTDSFVKACVAAIEAPARKKHITVKKELPDKWPNLVGDKDVLKVAIINILSNAVKYSPENSNITVSLNEEDHTINFDVIDQGYGISEVDLDHIFDQFYRSSDPHISEQTGSGLGLAMTSDIIQLHGGHIEVQSTEGQGTHFGIRLPKEDYHLGKQ